MPDSRDDIFESTEAPLEAEAPLTIDGEEAHEVEGELEVEFDPADDAEEELEPDDFRDFDRKHFWKTTAYVLLTVAIFIFGIFLGAKGFPFNVMSYFGSDSSDNAHELSLRLNEAAGYVDATALNDFDLDKATELAISSMLYALGDKYAEYYDEQAYQSYMGEMSDSFKGVGITLAQAGEYVVVEGVYDDSPASKAGFEIYDVILEVDGDDGSNCEYGYWTTSEMVSAIADRDEGDSVEFTVVHQSASDFKAMVTRLQEDGAVGEIAGNPVTLTATYEEFEIKDGSYKMIGDIGYIDLNLFGTKVDSFVKTAIEDLEEQGAKGIVLDLRDNPGGYVKSAVKVLSLFIDSDGTAVTFKGKNKVTSTDYKLSGNCICDLPMAVIINGNSASASEITTGALKDYERATVVGKTTYGKGVAQNIYKLSFGGAIKFTIADFYTPNGSSIDGVGISPDIEVEAKDSDVYGDPSTDTQLAAAIDAVNDQL